MGLQDIQNSYIRNIKNKSLNSKGKSNMTKYNYEQAMNTLTNGNKVIENKIIDLVKRYSAIDVVNDSNAFEKMADLATEFFALNIDTMNLVLNVIPGTNWASYDLIKYDIEIEDAEQKKVSDLNLFLTLVGSEMWRRGI